MEMDERQQLAEQVNHEFVDTMYLDFGWKNRPRYSEIVLYDMLQGGLAAHTLTGASWIYLRKDLEDYELITTCSHESAHILHKMLYRWVMRTIMQGNVDDKGSPKLSRPVTWLVDEVAELGALTFVSRRYPDLTQKVRDYIGDSFLSVKIFDTDPNSLRKLVNLEFEEARQFITSLTGEDIGKEP